MPSARRPFSSRCRPSVANTTGSPSSTLIAVVGPSPNSSQRCHSEVISRPGTDSSRATTIALFSISAYRYSVVHSCEATQCSDSRQITASQRAFACCSACFQRSPAGSRCAGPDPERSRRPDPAPARPATASPRWPADHPGWNDSKTPATWHHPAPPRRAFVDSIAIPRLNWATLILPNCWALVHE